VPQFLGEFVSKTTLWRKENGTPKGVILTISNPLVLSQYCTHTNYEPIGVETDELGVQQMWFGGFW